MFHVKQKKAMDNSLWFKTLCAKNGFRISETQQQLMSRYIELLLEWNKKINLISRKDEENVWESHILHCAALVLLFQFPENASVVDIGTGGGLPGIPLKILRPDLSLTLIDSTKKKIDAVSDMISRLGLKDIRAVWGRAEEISGRKESGGRFDFVVARAVAPLDELLQWSHPLLALKRNGKGPVSRDKKRTLVSPVLITLKGGDLTKEIEIAVKKNQKLKIETINLVFEGSAYLQANEKKAVIVEF
jgi:16S rRNA (guanine527-N7)-methyltransferase